MKKYLLSLLVGFVLFIGFGYCDLISPTSYNYINNSTSPMSFNCGGFCCFWQSSSNSSQRLSFTIVYGDKTDGFGSNINNLVCMSYNGQINVSTTNSTNLGFGFYDLTSFIPSCPEVNTGEILSGYILESEIDSGYCISNDLCPVFTGNNFSELIINDIVHESAPLINITIPEEYTWDYSVNENEFSLNISGQNVDYEYIDGIIKTQNSKPTVEDFNKIISELLPLFVPGLVIILFLIFVFRFVKKVF